MELVELLKKTMELGGSDVFIIPGSPVMTKVQGQLQNLTDERVMPADTRVLIEKAYEISGRSIDSLLEDGDDDFSFAIRDVSRFRCNTYRQRGTFAATLRVVAFGIPDAGKMCIPDLVMDLAKLANGLVLVTGPAGSGKSTTLACIIDKINRERSGHIITIEDPIEYLHNHKKALVSQREVPTDAPTFARALRAALRQAPDVIMLGEMRDAETIQTAITAAETGHLVLSSLHTMGAAKTVDRILDVLPPNQQQQIRVQLSMVLKAVVSQRLIKGKDGSLIPVFEMMTVNPAVQNLIRDGRTHQIDNAISAGQGMISMDSELVRMYKSGKIDRLSATLYAMNPDTIERRL